MDKQRLPRQVNEAGETHLGWHQHHQIMVLALERTLQRDIANSGSGVMQHTDDAEANFLSRQRVAGQRAPHQENYRTPAIRWRQDTRRQ